MNVFNNQTYNYYKGSKPNEVAPDNGENADDCCDPAYRLAKPEVKN